MNRFRALALASVAKASEDKVQRGLIQSQPIKYEF